MTYLNFFLIQINKVFNSLDYRSSTAIDNEYKVFRYTNIYLRFFSYHKPQVFECATRCLSKFPMQENRDPHASHKCGLIPVCRLLCVIRLSRYAKAFGQYKQVKGFSPVWLLSCIFSWPFQWKRLPQNLHSNFFSELCILMCVRRACTVLNSFWQILHCESGLLLQLLSSWCFSSFFCLNCLPHFSQTYKYTLRGIPLWKMFWCERRESTLANILSQSWHAEKRDSCFKICITSIRFFLCIFCSSHYYNWIEDTRG